MKAKIYNWIVKIVQTNGEIKFYSREDMSISLMRTHLSILRNKNENAYITAFKLIDTL